MSALRFMKSSLWLLLIVGFISSCSPKSTPPGANSIGGSVDGALYSYHYWQEGLAILIWHDFSYGGESCSGTSSTEDPVYRLNCDVEALDGRRFNWEVHSSDGQTADMWIDDMSFDLSQGTMFLVSSQDSGTQVVQLPRDFSELQPANETISAMAITDSDVVNFIDNVRPVNDPLVSDTQDGLVGFTDALRATGQSVNTAGQINQPFFSVPGQIIEVNGESVQVYEYPDSMAAKTEASQISPDASSVGTSFMTWVAPPHFYTRDRFIALYVGENEAVIGVLNQVLGEPIAEGQTIIVPTQNEPTIEPVLPDVGLLATLPEALANRNYAALDEMMGDPFNIGYWRSGGQTLTPAEAIEQLQLNLLPDPAKATFAIDPGLFPDLGEFDLKHAFGPDVQVVDLIYSQGWGADGQGEAILTIGLKADGSQYWPGMIYSFGGFSELAVQSPQEPGLPYETATYRNEANGFEFDYPATWYFEEDVLGERGSGAQFFSEGEFMLSAIVYLWDPKNDLDAYVDRWRQGWSTSGASVLSEAELTLAGGHRVVQFEIEGVDGWTKFVLFTEAGDRYLELSGTGNLNLLAEIAQTLRPSETTTELAAFESQVVAAVSSRDWPQMQALMDETFGFAFWGSEGYAASPKEAIANFQHSYLNADQSINFEVAPPDLSNILGPQTILSVWDPAQNPVKALFSTGWGPDSQEEAFLIIIQKPDGSYAWEGIILAHGSYGGFAGLYAPSTQNGATVSESNN